MSKNEFADLRETRAPESDNLEKESAASDVQVPQPVAPVAPVAAAPVAPAAPAAPQVFDRNSQIPGLRETTELSVEGLALKTKETLSKESKVRMMIPLDPGEKPGAYRTVSINGYRFDVQKNKMVDLPESVAKLLADAYSITEDVLENNPLNLSRADDARRKALGA